jgi:hypothetical protein
LIEGIFVLGLSTFGMTYLVCNTDGPKDIFKSLRKLAGVEYFMITTDDEGYKPPVKFFAKLLTCHWCTGTWIAILLSVPYVFLFKLDPITLLYLIPASLGISGFLCERVI